ncbi:MAG TPA: alkaline phosphatase family protein [Kofleriaceae bacterium]|nr:alkaline phosphatase family protein [Kofleriaceae bacterium]
MLPFHPTAPDLGLQFFEDLPHDWRTTHEAWNGGKYDHWVPSKGTSTMAFLTRDDLPFHFALADAFTVCDAYHCSFLGPTDPDRYHMWTGWTGNDGKNGGPVLDNAEAGYDFSTYPEVLNAAGISWKADRGRADLTVETIYEPARNTLVLEIHNAGVRVEDLQIDDAYARERTAHRLAPGERLTRRVSLERSFGWYDFTLRVDSDPAFRRQVAGHLETGNDSMSDPLLGR